jgi:hypothetical protein
MLHIYTHMHTYPHPLDLNHRNLHFLGLSEGSKISLELVANFSLLPLFQSRDLNMYVYNKVLELQDERVRKQKQT